MKELQKEQYVIYEPYLKKVYENPVNFNVSYGVDFYFKFPDLVDMKQCCFNQEKSALRKLRKLRSAYLEGNRNRQTYRSRIFVGEDSPEGLHRPNQQEFETELLSIFDRHYVVRKVLTTIQILDE